MDSLNTAEPLDYSNRNVEYRKRLLLNTAPSSKLILDLGCGSGAYFEILLTKSKQVVGVDVSRTLCRYAKSRKPECQVIVAEASRLPFRKRSFDGVWASEVLEHASFLAFDEVKRITCKWFLATMPNPYSSNYKADSSHTLRYSIDLIHRYYRSWTNWKISIRGIGIEYPTCRVKIPRFMKLLSVALLWHFPILAPTICIRGKREENKQPPRLNSQYGWQSATHAHSLRTAATESECLNLIARKEAGDDPKVSIVISTHNRKEKLRRLIESITKSDYSVDKREIFIVDDASTDGTFEMVTSLCPQARLLRTKNEVFPAKSRDIAAKSVTGEYLFFIDDDCLVTPTAITRLVEVALSMKNKAGIVAPLLTCLENPSAVWCAGASLRLNGLFDTAHMCQGLNPNRLQEEYRLLEIGYSPSAFLLKRSVYLEVGGFDYKDFPMGWEDIDLGLKVAKNGYKNICVTQAVVIHDKELRGRARNSMRAYHHGKSRTVFYRKYMGSKVPLMPIYLIGFSLWNADINLAFRYLNGVIQGLKEKLDTGNGCWKAGSPTLDSALAQEKILNLGCGDQVFGEVRLDRYRGAANVIADAETSLPFKDDSFDVVYSRFVFEHLRNPSFVLKEMVRVLEPEGKLVLITDNAAFPPFHLPASFGSGFHAGGYEGSGVEDRHYCLYTLEHLAHHFQYAGLKIETLKFVRADEVGGNDGIWQQITNLLRINKLRVLKPFCMSNILAVGRKPPKARAHA